MNFSQSTDSRLLAFYNNVRQQLDADKRAGSKYRFVGDQVKLYAEQLRAEMDRRKLRYEDIDWS